VLHLGRGQRAAKGEGRIGRRAACCDAVAEDLADDGAEPLGGFELAAGLDSAQRDEDFQRGDLADRSGPDMRLREVVEPSQLLGGPLRPTLALLLVQQLSRDDLECRGPRQRGADRIELLLLARIDALAKEDLRRIARGSGLGEADRRIGADREGLLLPGEGAGEAPELLSVRRYEEKEAPAVANFFEPSRSV
jgi:hypothetical protein